MPLADRVAARVASRAEVRRADPVTLEEFGALLGSQHGSVSHAGVSVTDQRALGLTAWWSGCRYLSEAVSGLPWHTYRGTQTSRERRSDALWLTRPDVDLPWAALVEHWMMSLLMRGNAYAYKIRGASGQVTGLRAVHPNRVRPGRASDGTKVFEVDNGGGHKVPLTSRELLHSPGLSYDGTAGLDPLRVHAEALGIAIASDEFAGRSFGQGSHGQAYISMPGTLKDGEADRIKAQWERFHRGVSNAHEFGVLGNGAEYKTISMTPEQVQLLETRTFGVLEQARILRIPPHKLYELSRATFSNIEHQNIDAATDSVRPWVRRIETWVNYDLDLLPARNFVEGQLEGLMRGDAASEAAAMAAAITGGWMTPQRAAQIKNLPAPDELDYYLRPLNNDVIRPGVPEQSKEDARKLAVAETVQKVYLGVGSVLTKDEARQIVNDAGGNLTGPGPTTGGATA